ncbi:alpha/beta hydrolase [Sporolactobacillus sp. STCC-11]|uniref:alpha/beta hydrolase n=1 Tax=Sporolactobacillus caesalpiniae TaxID=3230362 RepID=UPI00339A5A8F
MRVKRIFLLTLIVTLAMLVFNLSYDKDIDHRVRSASAAPKTSAEQTSKPNVQQIPTVFIHGWKGSERSFRTMFERLHANYDGPTRAMVVTVDPNGVVKLTGEITDQKIPLIQVLFVRNHESMEQQAAWLINVFRILKRDYGISRVNVVTHSMGGKAFTCYLEKIKIPAEYPTIKKYVAIAAPFDWINGPQNDNDYTISKLKQESYLYQHRQRLPKNMDVLALAGEIREPHEGDGVVTLQSAYFGKYFFSPAHYTEKMVYGPSAQHSMLHENPQVDRIIASYLWHIKPKK